MTPRLEIAYRSVESLIPYARNPRKNDPVVERMAAGIKEFGFRYPILVKSDGSIVDGHLRIKAARKLGLTEVPTVCADDMTEAQIKAFRLYVNRIPESVAWDDDLLRLELEELKEMDFDLELTGFDMEEIGGLLNNPTTGLTDPDDVPGVPEEPITKPGDIWLLGNHRLMCGDSTVATDVERLMVGGKANLVITSPPYFNQRPEYSTFKTYKEYNDFLYEVLGNILIISNEPFILAWNTGDNQPDCLPMIADQTVLIHGVGLTYLDTIIWKKAGAVYSIPRSAHIRTNQYYYPALAWEPIIIFRKGDKMPKFDTSDIDKVSEYGINIWEINQVTGSQQKKIGHPAIYPIELPKRIILAYSSQNIIIYEPFAGSGTTIIAAEMTGRSCYAMEIDPHYCDVAVKRWEDYTGNKATLENAP